MSSVLSEDLNSANFRLYVVIVLILQCVITTSAPVCHTVTGYCSVSQCDQILRCVTTSVTKSDKILQCVTTIVTQCDQILHCITTIATQCDQILQCVTTSVTQCDQILQCITTIVTQSDQPLQAAPRPARSDCDITQQSPCDGPRQCRQCCRHSLTSSFSARPDRRVEREVLAVVGGRARPSWTAVQYAALGGGPALLTAPSAGCSPHMGTQSLPVTTTAVKYTVD